MFVYFVLQAPDEAALSGLSESLTQAGVAHKLWIEQPENIPTCLALKPCPKETVQPLLRKFKLFKWRSWKTLSIYEPQCMTVFTQTATTGSHRNITVSAVISSHKGELPTVVLFFSVHPNTCDFLKLKPENLMLSSPVVKHKSGQFILLQHVNECN